MIRDMPAGVLLAVDRAVRRVIALVVESVDTALEAVPNPIPSGGQLRISRANGQNILSARVARFRKPVLAGVGAADWLAERLAAQQSRPAVPPGSAPMPRLNGWSARPAVQRC